MQVYEQKAQEILDRFTEGKMSAEECLTALDSALADLVRRHKGKKIQNLRAMALANHELVTRIVKQRCEGSDPVKISN